MKTHLYRNRFPRPLNLLILPVQLFQVLNLPLVFRAIRVAGFVAETPGRVAGSEIEPGARHVCPPMAAACRQMCFSS
jgi:hypothetical protein